MKQSTKETILTVIAGVVMGTVFYLSMAIGVGA